MTALYDCFLRQHLCVSVSTLVLGERVYISLKNNHCALQVASLEAALSQAQAKLSEHASSITVRASRAEEERWRWQSEAEELRGLLAGRDRDIGRLQSKQEVGSTARRFRTCIEGCTHDCKLQFQAAPCCF